MFTRYACIIPPVQTNMKPKQITWHKIADSLNELPLSSNGLGELEVAGKKICISLYHDQLHACAAKCPHAGGTMAAGHLDPLGNIICPLHRYKFSISKGYNVSGEGYFLKTYPVEQRSDGIFVGVEANNCLNWLK